MGWLKFLGIALAAMLAIFISQHSAHAFPWDEIGKYWWGDAAGEGIASVSASYEQGVRVGYGGEIYRLYRVLYEMPDTALILTRFEVEGEIRYYPLFLCVGREAVTGRFTGLVEASPDIWFVANEKSPLHRDEEFATLSTGEILDRIVRHPYSTLDYRHPVDCAKWAENYLHYYEKLPYLKNYQPNRLSRVADRTPFPRSGF